MSPTPEWQRDEVDPWPAATGMVRARVMRELRARLDVPVQLVVAPVGAGKSTTLHHLRDDLNRPVVSWCPDVVRTSAAHALEDIRRVLATVVDVGPGPWNSTGQALHGLRAAAPTTPVVLVADDLQAIVDTEALASLATIVASAPPWLRVVAASRRPLGTPFDDLLVMGRAVELPADLLRWRHWEVEELFADHYRARLHPTEAARLTHRTDGWSAGLHLFHLATRNLDPVARGVVVQDLQTTPSLVRDHLARHVFNGLPPDIADFMVETCVLGRLDAALCNALRSRDDSADMLAAVIVRGMPVVGSPDHDLRYHEVLRSHLEAVLVARDGPASVRQRQHRAGRLLEASGAMAEALECYARAGSDDVHRILQARGPRILASGNRTVLNRLPPSLVQADPWLQLARARQLVGDGRIEAAVDAYAEAHAAFGRGGASELFRREAATVASWARPRDVPSESTATTSTLLLDALRSDPRRFAAHALELDTTDATLAAGAAMLLAGDLREAARLGRTAATAEGCDVLALALARGLTALADVLGHASDEHAAALADVARTLEHLEIPWPARLLRLIASCVTDFDRDEVARALVVMDTGQDVWGGMLLRLVGGVVSVSRGVPELAWLDQAAATCSARGAYVLECWARSWEALGRARRSEPAAARLARDARRSAHHRMVPGAVVVADLALAVLAPPADRPHLVEQARVAGRSLGLGLPAADPAALRTVVRESTATTSLRVFGGLELELDGRRIDLGPLKPQARTVIALLALRTPAPVHRDHLCDALWPESDVDVQRRRLPVLVSTIRRFLEPDATPGDWRLLRRVGDAYLLSLPRPAWVDVRVFDDAVAAARATTGMRRRDSLDVAFSAYGGTLLPEFGAAEWLVRERDHYELRAGDVAEELGRIELEAGNPERCIEFVRVGLREDRYRSGLWRLLVRANEQLGDLAAAARSRREHHRALEELGVVASTPS